MGASLLKMKMLEPGESYSQEVIYGGAQESGEADDVRVRATFIDRVTGQVTEAEDCLTVVRVEIKPRVLAPENECWYRHKFGVRELVECWKFPNVPFVSWHANGNGVFSDGGKSSIYVCPLRAETGGIEISGLGVSYTPLTTVCEPSMVITSDVRYSLHNLVHGEAGGVTLLMRLHATPLDVSFQYIVIEEIPDADAKRSGYFEDSYFMREWYHGRDQKAGIWQTVANDNDFLYDEAGFVAKLPQLDARGFVSPTGTNGWINGSLSWDVPCGWADPGASDGDEPVGSFAAEQKQLHVIDSNGTFEVIKHGNRVTRSVDGTIILREWSNR